MKRGSPLPDHSPVMGSRSMYAPPKAAVLVPVVLTLVPVAVGTFLRLLCLAPYSVKLCQNAFALRRLLFFGRFSLNLLLPFRKLPLITLYDALSLIVGGHECLPVRVAMLLYHTGNSVLEIADLLLGGLYSCLRIVPSSPVISFFVRTRFPVSSKYTARVAILLSGVSKSRRSEKIRWM